jgi:hypothetical protein
MNLRPLQTAKFNDPRSPTRHPSSAPRSRLPGRPRGGAGDAVDGEQEQPGGEQVKHRLPSQGGGRVAVSRLGTPSCG